MRSQKPTPTQKWRWDKLTCLANTKSEARAIFKGMMAAKGYKASRLPVGANVVRVN